jgi:protein-tyrosine phosphatase
MKMGKPERAFLEKFGIQTIADFRSSEEQQKEPVDLPGGMKLLLPCGIDTITREGLRPLLLKRNAGGRIMAVIEDVYTRMVDMMKEPMRKLVVRMLEPDALPVIIHCRAGKDRTGFAAAVILKFLGVDDQFIFHDYLKSNDSMKPQIRKAQNRLRLVTAGLFPKANLQAAFEVKERYLRAALGRVDEKYGGVEGYLLDAGLATEQLDRLRSLLLNP